MAESKPASPPASARNQDYLLAAGLLLVTAVVFWPAIRWLTTQTFAHEQLKQSFLIVVLAGCWIAWEKRRKLRLVPRLGNGPLAWLCTSYALAAAAVFLQNPFILLGGLVAAAGGFVHCLFGSHAFRRTLPLLAVFTCLILLVLLFPILDWPLRRMAGIEAARLLKLLGLAPHLVVLPGPPAALLLLANGIPFRVATECNGFGLISSSLLLASLLLLYRRAPWWRHLLTLPVCVAVGFVFNFLRITTIVLLAPQFPGRYLAMHELVGLVALYSGLGLVWILSDPSALSRPAPAVRQTSPAS